ncbi:MAG: PepSY-associated TM helix domain-containing protein [Candidatus Marinimicrobia bacterium]|nr:PepSY-associated TM helix domain-containing protein [Candidatus Neomarinimicrobiota bacterium]MBL7023700.1 PepSY-associated TM helix domain-containing protein [Candidatus Neomarinimicrobiota bacterium]MBL7110006.1 PepSY-associated TM helix domain-containing protein [Candidatus Neomarinimicrobiota bacterium]
MMKQVRKWSRILHRDIGFIFIGASIIFGISGIALNHMSDWNPNYTVENKKFTTNINLTKGIATDEDIVTVVAEITKIKYMNHYYPEKNWIKIFLKGGSSIYVNTLSGKGSAEFLKKRPIFYEVNFLHYNPNRWWTWFSDIFSASLILFAITSLFMVKGKKGIIGRGGIYTLAGIVIPILFLIYS